MSLTALLQARSDEQGPVRIGVIGAGKFTTMFLAQVASATGLHVLGLADRDVATAQAALARAGWPEERYSAGSLDEAARTGATLVSDSAAALLTHSALEVIVESTGNPVVGTEHAVQAIEHGKHVVMVTVEADCLVGPLLQRRAQAAGLGYSLAYGDQPALICELVDWCRTAGFDVVAAGKGTKYLPEYHYSTPDTVWDYYGFTAQQLASGDYNPRMFNSFLDGTKSAIEMAAVANAAGLHPQEQGLLFPPAGTTDLPVVFREQCFPGGNLTRRGTVEVASSLRRDGRVVAEDLRWGVYVSFQALSDYSARCFSEYGIRTDDTGTYGVLYRPYHLIGLELAISIASVALRGEATGTPTDFCGDVVTTAKQHLQAGDTLDGEGGYTVFGTLAPARQSLQRHALPLGLAHGATLLRDIPQHHIVTWHDVTLADSTPTLLLRRELEGELY